MTDVVIDISQYTHQVVPRFEGLEQVITTQKWRYPSVHQWAQFVFFHDNNSNGLLVYIPDSSPEIQRWVISSAAKTLTISFESDNTPNIVQQKIESADWKVAADIYKDWAHQQSWYKRIKSSWFDNLQCHGTGSQSTGPALTSFVRSMKSTFTHNCAVQATNYRNFPFDDGYPDYSLNTGYDQAFADCLKEGALVFPHMNGLLWNMTDAGYDHLDMIWEAPVSITSVVDNGDGTYNFVLADDPERDGVSMAIDDQVVIHSSTNFGANNEVFTISSISSNQVFTADHVAGIGSVTDGNCHLVSPYNRTNNIDNKLMCHSVESHVTRLLTERRALRDVNGHETDAVYIDVINAMQPVVCYNPNHSHEPGDARQWLDGARRVVEALRDDKICVIEGWSECCLGLANGYLSANNNGVNKAAGLFDLIGYIYGDVVHRIGWDRRNMTIDADISAVITDGRDNFGKHPVLTFGATATPDTAIFDGTHTTSQANLQGRAVIPSEQKENELTINDEVL